MKVGDGVTTGVGPTWGRVATPGTPVVLHGPPQQVPALEHCQQAEQQQRLLDRKGEPEKIKDVGRTETGGLLELEMGDKQGMSQLGIDEDRDHGGIMGVQGGSQGASAGVGDQDHCQDPSKINHDDPGVKEPSMKMHPSPPVPAEPRAATRFAAMDIRERKKEHSVKQGVVGGSRSKDNRGGGRSGHEGRHGQPRDVEPDRDQPGPRGRLPETLWLSGRTQGGMRMGMQRWLTPALRGGQVRTRLRGGRGQLSEPGLSPVQDPVADCRADSRTAGIPRGRG